MRACETYPRPRPHSRIGPRFGARSDEGLGLRTGGSRRPEFVPIPYHRPMVIKPYAPRSETDPRRAAGDRAERQMAHYLDRYFAEHQRIHVLHDVRIEHGGDRAQIDHLVVHRFGIAIVESKSISTQVRINAQHEWERLWNGRWRGMPDPLLQAERQGLLIKRLLTSRTADLLDKVLGLVQGTFRTMAIDTYAAVSDQGTIRRARKTQVPSARKADAIPGAIQERIAAYRKAANVLNPDPRTLFADVPREFNDREVVRVAHFLRVQSAPAPSLPSDVHDVPPPAPEPGAVATESTPIEIRLACGSCGSHDMVAKVGRYGPYGACTACGRNTAVRPRCGRCGANFRVQREEGGFAGTCGSCGTRTHLRVGPTRTGHS